MAEKKYQFVRRFGPFVDYIEIGVRGIDALIPQKIDEYGATMQGYANNKEFLIAEVEGYATNYIPPPSVETPAPTVLPALPGVSPYRIEVLEESGALKSLVYFSNQLIEKREYDVDYTAIVGGEKFNGTAAVTAELENLINTTGIFANALAFPPFVKEEEAVDPQAEIKKTVETLGKLADSLADPLVALIPTEDDILEILAEKEPMIASMIKLFKQEKLEREEAGMSKEEAEEKFKEETKKMIDDYKEALKDMVKAELKKIKDNLGVFGTAVKNIPAAIAETLANLAIPPALGPVAPNLAHAVIQTSTVVKGLQVVLQNALVAFGFIMAGSLILKIALPQPLIDTYTVMLTLSALLAPLSL